MTPMMRTIMLALLISGACALALTSKSGRNSSTATSPGDVYLYASDFGSGTYRITQPGKYVLYQDVAFEPKGSGVTDTLHPDKDSTAYPQLGGYFLGFFAALTVEADNVEIDCKGHTIKMTERFLKHQRFFSIIELGSKPFIAGQGPPQFSSHITSPGAVKSANNVTISNCKLGLSSHHGIHGNNNNGVTLHNVQIQDFEVGGIALNGASKVVIEDVNIGPSLSKTFRASLSQAIFLDHLANTLLPQHDELAQYVHTTFVTLRGEKKTVKSVFTHLREELRKFLSNGDGELANLFGDGSRLPDGSAIYGLLLHKVGAAVADFGAGCGIGEKPDDHMVGPVTLKNVNIHDLKLNTDQVLRTVIDKGPQLMGPAGDVFQLNRLWNKDTYAYVGTPLSDAQVAMAVLKDSVSAWQVVQPITWADAKYYFGAVNIPLAVQEWAAGKLSDAEAKAWEQLLKDSGAYKCDGDAMSHHNKGVVGMRLEFQKDVAASDVSISSLMNIGDTDAKPYCTAPNYKGGDVYGVAVSHVEGFKESDAVVDKASLNAPNGAVVSILEASLLQQSSRRLRSMGMLGDDMN